MSCSRCCGLMVKDHFMDYDGTTGHTWMSAWRCMNCGHVHDEMIDRNRRAARTQVPVPEPVLAGGEPDYRDDEVHLGAESIVALAA